jgi:hypothetical protein
MAVKIILTLLIIYLAIYIPYIDNRISNIEKVVIHYIVDKDEEK